MKRKLLTILLSIGVVLGSTPMQAWAEENTEENAIVYEETAGEDYEISGADLGDSYVDSMPDNDALLEGYIQQLFSTDSISFLAVNKIGPMILSGDSLLVYNYMAEKIKEIASGNNAQAVIQIPYSMLVEKMSMTSAELGQSWHYDPDKGLQGVDYSPLYAQLDVDFSLIMDCLLRDYPYEMYWYDKTQGFVYSSSGASASYSHSGSNASGSIFFRDDAHYTITMCVAEAYQKTDSRYYESKNGKRFYYEVDGTNMDRVQTALNNASAILDTFRKNDDYSKLVGYKTAICELVDYNYPAAYDSSTPFGDPWQMVYVFDGDPDTKVVCEGYSKAFQYLCNKTAFSNSEIMCYIVTGQMQGSSGSSGGHMWNIVHMDDGMNYIADVTNSDDGSVGSRGGLFLNGMEYLPDPNYCYTANSLSGNSHVYYWYDNETKDLFSEEQLTLSDTDYIYTGTGEPEPDEEEAEVEICANSFSLIDDGIFRVNTYLQIPNSCETEVFVQAEYDDLYADIYDSGNNWMDINVESLDGYESDDDCMTYIVPFAVNSGELTRPIHISLRNADNETLDEITVSASEILYYYLSDEFIANADYTEEEYSYFGNVSKAALNYGSAAQIYFGNWYGDDGRLANAELSVSDQQVSSITDNDFISGDIDFRILKLNDQLKGVSYVGSSLILKDEIMLRHYFLPDDVTDIERISVSLNDNSLSTDIIGDMICVEYPVIFNDPRIMETLSISYSANDSVETRSEFAYSLMNYYGKVYTTSQNEALVTLISSLYQLGETLL